MERADSCLPKLTVNSYQRWKFDMIAVLESKGLLEYVVGSLVKPELSADNADAVRKWTMEDARAESLISVTLDDEHHVLIRSCVSSKEIWDTLVNYREQSPATNKFLCHQQFYEHCFKPDDSISGYLSELTSIVKKLKDLGTELAEETIAAKVINDLPKEYESFRTSWRLGAVGGLKLTFKDLQAQLLVAEKGVKGNGNSELRGGDALLLRKRDFKKRSKAECWNCGKTGHIRRNCKAKKQVNGRASEPSGNVGLMASSCKGDGSWILDSGASAHMSSHREWFSEYRDLDIPVNLTIGNGQTIQAVGTGKIHVKVFNGVDWGESFLSSVLFVPELGAHNLFSVGVVPDKGYSLKFDGSTAALYYHSSDSPMVIAKRSDDEKIYRLVMEVRQPGKGELGCLAKVSDLRLAHERLGHANMQCIAEMVRNGTLPHVKINSSDLSSFFCEGCAYGKMHKLPAKSSKGRNGKVGETVHADVVGPMECPSLAGSRFALVLKDELTAYRTVYFLNSKNQVADKIEQYLKDVKRVTQNSVRTFRSDNGTEFFNSRMIELFRAHDIKHELSAPYTPEQNGMAERENRSLIEMARTMLHSKQLPKSLWAEAMNTASYVMNRIFNRNKSPTPYELWCGKVPEYDHMRTFGCDAYALVPEVSRKKWDSKADKMVLVGYTDTLKKYRLYDPIKHRVVIAKHVRFDESSKNLVVSSQPSNRAQPSDDVIAVPGLDDDKSDDQVGSIGSSQQNEAISSSDEDRAHSRNEEGLAIPSNRYNLRDRSSLPVPRYLLMSVVSEPSSYEEALKSPDKGKWVQAMEEELSSLYENKTFELTPLPPQKKAI